MCEHRIINNSYCEICMYFPRLYLCLFSFQFFNVVSFFFNYMHRENRIGKEGK